MTATSQPEAQSSGESKPAETSNLDARPLARDVYDWASRLTAEAGGIEEYYWTPQTERIVSKLELTKRALIGVVGVQGTGKSAAMRAISDILNRKFHDSIVAVKVPESSGLIDTLGSAFKYSGAYHFEVRRLVQGKIESELKFNAAFIHRAQRLASQVRNSEVSMQVERLSKYWPLKEPLSPALADLVPRRMLRDLEGKALQKLVSEKRVILIDMPDYPKHDRRLIARDLDDVQGLWNRLATSDKDTSLIVFLQKETFNYGDHFFLGKMDIIPLMPLTVTQLLEAYNRRWSGYAPFNGDALQYVAKMSRGVFRRFKRYIGLALEARIAERAQADVSNSLIDIEAVKELVTDEEAMRDMDKELDGIFKNRAQKELAVEIIRYLSLPQLKGGTNQKSIAHDRHVEEMTVSRLIRELEQHGYVKRTSRPMPFGGEENIVQMNW